MPAIGRFGALADFVTITPGDPFNEFWEADGVAGGSFAPVFTLSVSGVKAYHLTGLYVSASAPCCLDLKKDGISVWKGRIWHDSPDRNPLFPDGPIVAAPGEEFKLYLKHEEPGSKDDFWGNLFGFKR